MANTATFPGLQPIRDEDESPEEIAQRGLLLIEHLKRLRFKDGKLVVTDQALDEPTTVSPFHFSLLRFVAPLTGSHLQAEYVAAGLPRMSLNIIEGKLHARQYANLVGLKADVQVLTKNLKHACMLGATSEHSMRIRRAMSDFMVACKRPIAGRSGPASVAMAQFSIFGGLSVQKAQEKILTEMIELADESGDPTYGVFLDLPPAVLVDYYRTIERPMSLNMVLDRIRASTPALVWDELEADMSLIWNNAFQYNQDESEIFRLAGRLEALFQMRLDDAKKNAGEPAASRAGQSHGGPQRIKLTVAKPAKRSEKIMLRLKKQPATVEAVGPERAPGVGPQSRPRKRKASESEPSAVPLDHGIQAPAPLPEAEPTSVGEPLTNATGTAVATATAPTPTPATATAPAPPQTHTSSTPLADDAAQLMPPPPVAAAPSQSAETTIAIAAPKAAPEMPWKVAARADGEGLQEALLKGLLVISGAGVCLPDGWVLDVYGSATTRQPTCVLDRVPADLDKVWIIPRLAARVDPLAVTVSVQRDGWLHPAGIGRVLAPAGEEPCYETELARGSNHFWVEVTAPAPASAAAAATPTSAARREEVIFECIEFILFRPTPLSNPAFMW
ncbi:MAG: hypothetical protein M1826_005849 [Phylliscum demangeonii]|nr:MAG: hypothetical protein M1826_005849 [Phylliscum demangeonii]